MTKKKADYLLHRCYRLLRDPAVTITLHKHKPPYVGMAFPWSQEMTIDPRGEVLSVVVHECLHLLYPEAREREVLRMERGIVRHMTERQWRNLYVRAGMRFKRRA